MPTHLRDFPNRKGPSGYSNHRPRIIIAEVTMFHLLTDQAIATLADIEIPFVAVEYDRGTFTQYGARQGCEGFDGLLRLHRERPNTFESLLQT